MEPPCDPHEGTPLAVPDFLSQELPASRTECPYMERSIAGHGEGVGFPTSPVMTSAEIAQACAETTRECRAQCEGLLSAEVALRLYRRVQRGAYTLRGNFGQTACSELVSAAADVVEGTDAHAIWDCLVEPIPGRVELRLEMETDSQRVRRIRDVVVRGAFAPSGEHPVELGFVEEGMGCGHRGAVWTLRDHPPGSGDECEEHGDYVCMAECSDAECGFTRQFVPPPP